ncbi:tRNA (guanosine(46)-N7)-methyltransferase TrmB [Acutalibacter sp. 1XD8-33]|uniref:tRNA (guanosine(46)-N7)-methyltransferase TrmB n=1 Tax=Acutalibacter sp. 1XD8-33 TaxID=2320081 RepID=UPI000EA0B2CC|nr:tRNA (guanosine(46)-N7)-methyltransferase TrmB [Acutalibacter sp. 1XD8-33]RKJ39175.1 tRNA (guanosine(46)-N7)-methyltransferase TrmB [Acutalibacter sp. 1XD8-33]
MRIRKKAWARPELAACGYYIEDPAGQKGRWQEGFGEKRPLHLDLGCGKCVFLAEAARNRPDVNFVGIDISYDILGVGRRNIQAAFGEREPDNVLLCYYNIERLPELFAPGEADRLYINFCNPWPAAGCHKRRLTHTRQLLQYKPLLAPGGEIWFKTDNDDLYLATKRYLGEAGFEIFYDTRDLHGENDPENILTEHELMFSAQGIQIKALRARHMALGMEKELG